MHQDNWVSKFRCLGDSSILMRCGSVWPNRSLWKKHRQFKQARQRPRPQTNGLKSFPTQLRSLSCNDPELFCSHSAHCARKVLKGSFLARSAVRGLARPQEKSIYICFCFSMHGTDDVAPALAACGFAKSMRNCRLKNLCLSV